MNAALKLDASAEDSGPEQSQARLLSHAEPRLDRRDVSWVGKTIEGRYRIDGVLGESTLGTVYLAHHVHTRKSLALKLLDPALMFLGDAVPRFEREAVATARVNHPNVVAASDFGRLPDGVLYLVLEHVKGPSLREVLAAGPLALERTLSIVDQIVQGLGAAHALGIVHRGVKPENVLLVQRAAGELVEAAGLRPRRARGRRLPRRRPDPDRHDAGNSRIHGAGTSRRPLGRREERPVRGRRGAPRADHRSRAVRGRGCGATAGHAPSTTGAAAAAVRARSGRLARPGSAGKDPERRIQNASECALRIESVRAALVTGKCPAPPPEASDSVREGALAIGKSRAGWIAGICALTLLSGGVSALIGRHSSRGAAVAHGIADQRR